MLEFWKHFDPSMYIMFNRSTYKGKGKVHPITGHEGPEEE
jgi:hypothetical protein